MNCCLARSAGQKFPAAQRSFRQHGWWMRQFKFTAALVIGLMLFALAGTLNAEDAPDASNPDASGSTNAPAAAPSADDSMTLTTNAFNVLDDKYRLSIGDKLSFQIIEDEDPPQILTVTDSGELQVPYIGRYPAAGKTCKELAHALKIELEKEYYRQATVIIAVDSKPRSRGKIYLVGAVRSPGSQDISSDEDMTVSRAILRAGSFTDFADEKNVRVTRGTGLGPDGKKTFTVNVARVFEKGRTEDDLPVQPGDLIFVPERMIRF
jgi:protein involved in polysaccharide export with SLBB domain